MNEVAIACNLLSPQEKNTPIKISVTDVPGENLLFKFIIGRDGTWEVLKDFSGERGTEWIAKDEGKFIIMVQARREGSTKPFDYVSKMDYIIGKIEEKLITRVYLEKNRLNIGERLSVAVEANKLPVMYRYWMREEDKWEMVKDYSAENNLIWSVKTPGIKELLVECKAIDSRNDFDDFVKESFEVLPIEKLQITDLKCLTEELLTNRELVFEVECLHDDKRMVLYRFLKVQSDGQVTCLQDFSTKKVMSYREVKGGDYRLLCLAKDMYSPKEYDDRALLYYKVKPYKPLNIQSFTSDLSSPQICETPITLKAIVSGGNELLFRYRIDGNHGVDSGYIRQNNFLWNPKAPGSYKITLWVKDVTYEGTYEKEETIDFTIDEISKEPVYIEDIILDKKNQVVKNEAVNIKVNANGGVELKYSFIVHGDEEVLEKIDYGDCSWVNFTPEKAGKYQVEVRVKDKFSKREYDSHSIVHIEAFDFIPASIDYILFPAKEYYMIGDAILLHVIVQNTKNTLLKYMLHIDGHMVEETDYAKSSKYSFAAKHKGIYTVDVYAKDRLSTQEYDSKKELVINIYDSLPITNAKIQCDTLKPKLNEPVNFKISNEGGKEVLYEFYLMEKGEWNIVQKYSRKNDYTFIPFFEGDFKILALCKSSYKKCAYEDYDTFEFRV